MINNIPPDIRHNIKANDISFFIFFVSLFPHSLEIRIKASLAKAVEIVENNQEYV